jgi:hypothetical protein
VTNRSELSVIFAAVLAVQALTFLSQTPINIDGGQGYDGKYYYAVAQQIVDGESPSGMSRFARRLGTPLLAALVSPDDLIEGFLIVNVCATLVSPLLLVLWLRNFIGDPRLRIVLVLLYATHWLQLVRFTFFYPVLVDAWAQMFCFAGLNCMAWYERRPGRWPALAVAAISAIGVLFRELVLLVPLAFLFARNPTFGHRLEPPYFRVTNLPRLEQWLPVILACAVIAVAGSFVAATDPEFSPANHFEERAFSRRLFSYLLGWMVAFGPILFLIAFDWRSVVQFFRQHTSLLVYFLGAAATGWVASLESERHALYWASPVVLALLGRTIQRYEGWFRSPAVLRTLVVVQAVVHRAFLTTPLPYNDPAPPPLMLLTPFGEHAHYLQLFPDYLPARLAWVQLLEHLLVGVVLVAWLSRYCFVKGQRPRVAGEADVQVGLGSGPAHLPQRDGLG